jgi:hypothetical protein
VLPVGKFVTQNSKIVHYLIIIMIVCNDTFHFISNILHPYLGPSHRTFDSWIFSLFQIQRSCNVRPMREEIEYVVSMVHIYS